MLPVPAAASIPRDDEAALSAYAQARAADSIGALDRAAQEYQDALARSPANPVLAARALQQGLVAGDRGLALSAARILERAGDLPPDGRLLLLGEAVMERKWKVAEAHAAAIEKDEIFSFLAPLVRAWIAHGSKRGDPLKYLEAAKAQPLGLAYAAEQRPLLLMASGKVPQAIAALAEFPASAGTRAQRLRLSVAAMLVRKGERKAALALLDGEEPALVEARERIEARKPVAPEVSNASAGLAELLLRMAVDLHGQEVPQLALAFSRIATFMAPGNSDAWLVTSELLQAGGQRQAALAALANVPGADPQASAAAAQRMKLLADSDRGEEAIAIARAAASAPGAGVEQWSSLGEIYARMERFSEAAAAYEKAIELTEQGGRSAQPEWALWLLKGSALEQADRWPEAKAALQAAYKLAPTEAVVLNYLGYAQLERRENIEESMKLIAEASRLEPDSAEITDSLGWAHYLRGNVPRAIELLEKAVEGEPASFEINEHLGDAYYSAGRRVEARYAWSAALVTAEGADAARLRAKIERGLRPELASP